MSRRKQSRPVKRPLEEDEQEHEEKTCPETKNIRLDQPSTSKAPLVAVCPPPVPSTNALALLEKSLKKFEPTSRPSVANARSPPSGSLGALFNCIGKISSPATPSELDGVSSILKCLQCGAGFPVMEQLVKHMQETKHFSNLPKTYSNLMSQEKMYSNPAKPLPVETMRLACFECGEIPKDMDRHLRDVHLMKKRTHWQRNAQEMATGNVVPLGLPAVVLQSPHIKQIMSILNAVGRPK